MPDPVVITVAPTGPLTTRKEHPAVPLTPEEIGIAVAEAHEAGAAVAHVHARDEEGKPTAEPAIYAAIVDEIRSRCDIVVQASTRLMLEIDRLHEAEGQGIEVVDRIANMILTRRDQAV